MSALTNVFLTGGVLVLVLIAIAMVYFGIQQATEISQAGKIQSEKNMEAINAQNKAIDQFINAWFNRINASNVIQNNIQDQLLNISRTLETRQNEHIQQNTYLSGLLENRTELFNEIIHGLNNLNTTASQEKQVRNYQAIQNNTKILNSIVKALNISQTDTQTDAELDRQLVEQLLNQLNRVPPGQLKK